MLGSLCHLVVNRGLRIELSTALIVTFHIPNLGFFVGLQLGAVHRRSLK